MREVEHIGVVSDEMCEDARPSIASNMQRYVG
jgi:uncharacterized protein YijF (DUF1287 family)